MFMFRLFVTNRALKLGLNAALEADVPVQAVGPRVRITTPGAGVSAADRRRHCRYRRRNVDTFEHRYRQWPAGRGATGIGVGRDGRRRSCRHRDQIALLYLGIGGGKLTQVARCQ